MIILLSVIQDNKYVRDYIVIILYHLHLSQGFIKITPYSAISTSAFSDYNTKHFKNVIITFYYSWSIHWDWHKYNNVKQTCIRIWLYLSV